MCSRPPDFCRCLRRPLFTPASSEKFDAPITACPKVYFESLPGFFVTGNLYRPIGDGPFPAVLSPHGHWAYGRLENTVINSGPGRAITLARQGFVVFTYDMVGYNDSQQVPHTFSGQREYLWGLSLSGLQLWDSIRALDFLVSLPYVHRDAIGMTGESGGGTQTFLASAVDPRIAVSVPVNMISLHMQGGCLCENPPGLRLETTNVEIAATIAPRPLLMISATGDWTNETLESEYPAVRGIYNLLDAPDQVRAVRITAEHNYNKESREAMYAWMARWLQHAPADAHPSERSFTVEPLQNLLVFYQRALPSNAVDVAGLTAEWIDGAKRQLAAAAPDTFAATLRHALGFAQPGGTVNAHDEAHTKGGNRAVLLTRHDPELEPALTAARFTPTLIEFTPFDAEAATKIHHFDTYNRILRVSEWPISSPPCVPIPVRRSLLTATPPSRRCSPAPSSRFVLPCSTSMDSILPAIKPSSTTCIFRAFAVLAICEPPRRCLEEKW